MKRTILLAVLCLLLAGCTPQAKTEQSALPQRLAPTKETENDTLKCYPTDGAECRFFTVGDDLYQVRCFGEQCWLLRFSGKLLRRTAAFPLPCRDCRVSAGGSQIVCYDPEGCRILLLSPELTLTQTIPLPEPITGTPMADDRAVYYTTAHKLAAADPESGIHRTLRAEEGLTLTGLSGEMLLCASQTGTHCISPADGALLKELPTVSSAMQSAGREYLAVKCGANDCLYMTDTMLPLAPGTKFLAFSGNAALVFRAEAENAVILYDLTTGNQLSRTQAAFSALPEQVCTTEDGRVFFCQEGYLFQWLPVQEPAREYQHRISRIYTADKPDEQALSQCRQKAALLEGQFGFQILLNDQAAEILPPGCTAEAEYLAPYLTDALSRVEQALLRLPGLLVRSAVRDTGICRIGIVRSLTGNGEALEHLQFWNGRDCYILLTASENAGDSLLRGLSAMLDARVMSRSNAYDLWDSLNPAGFVYGTPGAFSCFAEESGTLSPAKDREGLWIAAISPGNRERFCDALLQRKLRQLCIGLREAFPGIENGRVLIWEQYLWEPI